MARGVRLGAVAAALVAGLVAAVAVPADARADGDPASDVLYTQNLFVPFDTVTSKGAQTALASAIASAKRAGYPIRVALIEKIPDLGAVGSLWGKPRQYAKFLDLELAFTYKGPLLVVMPSGIGFAHYEKGTAAEDRRLASIPVRQGNDGPALAAIAAVVALAKQAGHPIATPAVPKESSSSGVEQRLLAGGVALAVVLVAVTVFALVRRRRPLRA